MLKQFFIVGLFSLTTRIYAADTSIVLMRYSPLPVSVHGTKDFEVNLGGRWHFDPAPLDEVGKTKVITGASWKTIQVPGEWAMQGFKVGKSVWAAYAKPFIVPGEWMRRRIKLICDAVYSECEVFVNGEKAGVHAGGFTAFETDITRYVKPGAPSIIVIRVKNESVADSLASGSKYAVHQLGGITRKIRLVALPELNLSGFQIETIFDERYRNAILKAEVLIANESREISKGTKLQFDLSAPHDARLVFSKTISLEEALLPGNELRKIFEFPVFEPEKWDTEHPNLYTLSLALISSDSIVELTKRKVGFRQVEVKGNRVFVNNIPIKLRGVCRHEVMPLRGRSLTGNQWAEDAKIFRDGNVNYFRTSHYPPAIELVEACDSLGIFLEVEAPFCWAHQTNVSQADSVMMLHTQTLDMVQYFKSNPSVLMWSLGNESLRFKEYFSKTAELIKMTDPSRPRVFSQWGPDGDDNKLEIGNHHYPGPAGPNQYANAIRPMLFDEYVHINAYNRYELAADPGIRDAWGIGFAAMWNNMYKTPSILGGAIWAGIDDTFIWEDTTAVGYGTWGVIDGWRRLKPEYWHMKKAYSPVIISQRTSWKQNGILLKLENRHLFSNIAECRIYWQIGHQSGVVQPFVDPGHEVDYKIICKQPLPGETLYIKVYDPRAVLVDEYAFDDIVPRIRESPVTKMESGLKWSYTKQSGKRVVAVSKDIEVVVFEDGSHSVYKNKELFFDGFAELMLLPLNGNGDGIQMTGNSLRFPAFNPMAKDRIIKKIEYDTGTFKFTIKVWDKYDEAEGFVEYGFLADGTVGVNFQYQVGKHINPRQWGIVFSLPSTFSKLHWERKGLWNYYPPDHIGRITGTADASNGSAISGVAGPLTKPEQEWRFDRNEWGSNDFRSTKMNVINATLASKNNTLVLRNNAGCHIRCWTEGRSTRMLIAPYSNLGSEGFYRDHAKMFEKPLKPGDIVEGSASLVLR